MQALAKINKASAAVIAGAVVAVVGVFFTDVDKETLAAVQTILIPIIVFLGPKNAE